MTVSHSSQTLAAHCPSSQVGSRELAPGGTQPPVTRGLSCLAPARPPELGVHSSASLRQTLEPAKDTPLPGPVLLAPALWWKGKQFLCLFLCS